MIGNKDGGALTYVTAKIKNDLLKDYMKMRYPTLIRLSGPKPFSLVSVYLSLSHTLSLSSTLLLSLSHSSSPPSTFTEIHVLLYPEKVEIQDDYLRKSHYYNEFLKLSMFVVARLVQILH